MFNEERDALPLLERRGEPKSHFSLPEVSISGLSGGERGKTASFSERKDGQFFHSLGEGRKSVPGVHVSFGGR